MLLQPEEEVASGGPNGILAIKLLQRWSCELHNKNREIPTGQKKNKTKHNTNNKKNPTTQTVRIIKPLLRITGTGHSGKLWKVEGFQAQLDKKLNNLL